MIVKSNKCTMSRWKDMFYACRTVVRSEAGLNVAEFVLPLLVLDRICFGSPEEFEDIVREFLGVMQSGTSTISMTQSDRQKAVNAFFSVIDTLSFWADRETEDSIRNKRTSTSTARGTSKRKLSDFAAGSSSDWSAEDCKTQILELTDRLPLALQAKAASEAGMHARALLLLEKDARKNDVGALYESKMHGSSSRGVGRETDGTRTLNGIDLKLMKKSLASLGDCDTMVVVGEEVFESSPLLDVSDRLLQKEESGDFEGSLQDYERLLQVDHVENGDRSRLERGALKSLVETGRFEEVLSRTAGFMEAKDHDDNAAYAAEAAWRLGRWDTLSSLVKNAHGNLTCNDDSYRWATAKAMLRLHEKDEVGARGALNDARRAVMDSLSSFARESYSRSYSDIVRLQCIREIEDASALLCSEDMGVESLKEAATSNGDDGWAWDGRLKLATPTAASTIMSTRATIARLGGDPLIEGSMFLGIGKQARKSGKMSMSERNLTQAEAVLSNSPSNCQVDRASLDNIMHDIRTQYAKLKHCCDDSRTALKILGQESVDTTYIEMIQNPDMSKKLAINYERERTKISLGAPTAMIIDEQALAQRFARRLLRLSKWAVEGGLQSEPQNVKRFQSVVKLADKLEKGMTSGRTNIKLAPFGVVTKLNTLCFFALSQDIFIMRNISRESSAYGSLYQANGAKTRPRSVWTTIQPAPRIFPKTCNASDMFEVLFSTTLQRWRMT